MPHIESEVLEFAMMLVKESAESQKKGFSERQIRRIALHVLKNDKLHAPEWIDDYVASTHRLLNAKKKSQQSNAAHPEFTGFRMNVYQRFVNEYGVESFSFMKSHLQDTTQIAPPWAAQFVATVMSLGGFKKVEEDAAANEQNVWEFVTKTHQEEWNSCRSARKPWFVRSAKPKKKTEDDQSASASD